MTRTRLLVGSVATLIVAAAIGCGSSDDSSGDTPAGSAGSSAAGAGGSSAGSGGTGGASAGSAGTGGATCAGVAVGKGKTCSEEMFCKYGPDAFGKVRDSIITKATASGMEKDLGDSFVKLLMSPSAKVEAFKTNLGVFLIAAYGGDKATYKYTGSDMKTAHAGLGITTAQYNAFIMKVVVPALADNGVAMDDINNCFAPVVTDAALVSQIVEKPLHMSMMSEHAGAPMVTATAGASVRGVRKAVIIGVCVLGALTVLTALAHTRAARPLLLSLAGRACPVPLPGSLSPEQREAGRQRAMAAYRGPGAAASHPALQFALGKTRREDVSSWRASSEATCRDEPSGSTVTCTRVPLETVPHAYRGAPITSMSFRFDPAGTLVAAEVTRNAITKEEAAGAMATITQDLVVRVGSPTRRDGEVTPAYFDTDGVRYARAEFRYRDYYASVSAGKLGALGIVLTEEYHLQGPRMPLAARRLRAARCRSAPLGLRLPPLGGSSLPPREARRASDAPGAPRAGSGVRGSAPFAGAAGGTPARAGAGSGRGSGVARRGADVPRRRRGGDRDRPRRRRGGREGGRCAACRVRRRGR